MRSSASAAALALLIGGPGATVSIAQGLPRGSAATGDDPASSGNPVLLPPEAGAPTGPAGTSGMGPPRYDAVGFAAAAAANPAASVPQRGAGRAEDAITGVHRSLPSGSHAEVTSLSTGRTILVLITEGAPPGQDRLIALSRGAAALLGIPDGTTSPVRVRAVLASAREAAALAQGRPADPRLNAPPALLKALRGQLAAKRPATATAPKPSSPPLPAGKTGYLVQVAALSDPGRARSLAADLGGFVEPAGSLHRVRLGPFDIRSAAERARDGAVRRGYGDATILVQP